MRISEDCTGHYRFDQVSGVERDLLGVYVWDY